MKAITLHQPWASLIAHRLKTIETRSWSTKYRGPLAIHAGLRVADDTLGLDDPPTGVVVAVADLVDVVPMVRERPSPGQPCLVVGESLLLYRQPVEGPLDEHADDDGLIRERLNQERTFGDYRPGRWAWVLASIVPLDPPVPASGRQGLWEWQQ